jgi:hypothetical protein
VAFSPVDYLLANRHAHADVFGATATANTLIRRHGAHKGFHHGLNGIAKHTERMIGHMDDVPRLKQDPGRAPRKVS